MPEVLTRVDEDGLANRLAAGRDPSCPKCGGTRPTCCTCVDTAKLWVEHQRLKDAVVEAAKGELIVESEWVRVERSKEMDARVDAAHTALLRSVDALIAFEAEHNIGGPIR